MARRDLTTEERQTPYVGLYQEAFAAGKAAAEAALRERNEALEEGLMILWQLEAYPSRFYKRVKEMIHFLLHGVDSEGYGQDAADDVARALLARPGGGAG